MRARYAIAGATYDANGNPTALGGATYTWDGANRLATATVGAAPSTFTYDGLSHIARIVDTKAGAIVADRAFTWCGDERCAAHDNTQGSSPVATRYFAQGVVDGGNALYYVRDLLGSVRQVVDTSGSLRAQYDYDPYGNRTKVSGDVETEIGYAGYYHHAASGLDLALYRAYDAAHGRWLNRDPIEEAGGTNLYGYVGGNPVNGVDPAGLINVTFSPGGFASGFIEGQGRDERARTPSSRARRSLKSMDPLLWLQEWFAQQCDGDWEHSYGVHVATLDNPGWRIAIAFAETTLSLLAFEPIVVERTDADWLRVWVKDSSLEAACGARNLTETLIKMREIVESHVADPASCPGRFAAAVSKLCSHGVAAVSTDHPPRLDGGAQTVLQSTILRVRITLDHGEFGVDLAHPNEPEAWYCLSELERAVSGPLLLESLDEAEQAVRAILERGAAYAEWLADEERLRDANIAAVKNAYLGARTHRWT